MNINPIIKKLLYSRGIMRDEEIEEFLSPEPKRTYDPMLMKDMEAAVNAIISYAQSNRKICIYGDYDADGVTSVTLLSHVIKYLTDNVCHYIPSRFNEGYGLNIDAIKSIKENGTEMIITVDCGCVSFEEVEYAKSIGIFMIVTDHHNIDGRAPQCLLINPKQESCGYPCDMLCGCGVAFKLAQALQRRANLPRRVLNEVLDLVAIATVGDVVPLIDENRTLVKIGMRRIAANKRLGLSWLMNLAGISPQKIDSYRIAFGIVPRINASGRMNTAENAVELLMSDVQSEAERLAGKLCDDNDERRSLQEELYEQLKEIIDIQESNKKILIINAGDAHEGITGIVAGKLKDEYNLPVIIVAENIQNGMLKGTGRSIEGVSIIHMIEKYSELFERYGGHTAACGFTMKSDLFDTLKTGLEADADVIWSDNPILFEKRVKADASIEIKDITFEFIEQLNLLEPFGQSNEKPLFLISNVSPKSAVRIGAKKDHLRFMASDNQYNKLTCLYFGAPDSVMEMAERGEKFDILGYPQVNDYMGRKTLQFIVSEIQ